MNMNVSFYLVRCVKFVRTVVVLFNILQKASESGRPREVNEVSRIEFGPCEISLFEGLKAFVDGDFERPQRRRFPSC